MIFRRKRIGVGTRFSHLIALGACVEFYWGSYIKGLPESDQIEIGTDLTPGGYWDCSEEGLINALKDIKKRGVKLGPTSRLIFVMCLGAKVTFPWGSFLQGNPAENIIEFGKDKAVIGQQTLDVNGLKECIKHL